MTIGRTIGHTARHSHKFHIKCNQIPSESHLKNIYIV